MGFSRQECWSGLPCPPPRNFPHPEIEPASPLAALPADYLSLSHCGNCLYVCIYIYIYTHIYFLLDHYVKCIYFCRLSSKILKATGLCSNSPLIASIFLSYRDEGHSPCSFFRLISWLVNLFIYLAAPGLSCGTWDLCSLVVACRIFSCGMQYLFP